MRATSLSRSSDPHANSYSVHGVLVGTDHAGRLGIDEGLEHEAEHLTHTSPPAAVRSASASSSRADWFRVIA